MRRSAAGFTILEILVVILIIGAITGIAIPRLSTLLAADLKSAARKLGGGIQFCFNEAVIKQASVRLMFNLDSGEYWLTYLAVSGSTGEFVELTNRVFPRQQLPAGIFFKDFITPHNMETVFAGEDFITFYPTGYAEQAVIHLGSENGEVYTVLVKPLTGKIVVYDRDVQFSDLGSQFGGSTQAAGGL